MKMASLSALIVGLLFPLMIMTANVQASTIGDSSMSMAAGFSKKSANKLKVGNREQAIQLVKRQYQGKVLKAQPSRFNGHSGYKIKLISNEGVVFYLFVDAQTGSVHRN